MKKYLLMVGMLYTAVVAIAQAEFDALKYSLTDLEGTARYVSISGAFGALGGDMSSIRSNPAGLSIYRSTEISVTPTFSTIRARSSFDGAEASDSRQRVSIGSAGYISSIRTYDETAISNFNFGITYNRIKDYNRNSSIKGYDRPFSLLNRICNDQNDGHSNLLDAAYETWLVDQNADSTMYVPILNPGERVNNAMYLIEKGGIDEWNFSAGANYAHKLYLGMGLGIQTIRYEMESLYQEDFQDGGAFDLKNVLTTEGAGINLKIGVIYRPLPSLRLGFACHTPTYYTLTDVYGFSMISYGVSGSESDNVAKYIGDEGATDYQLKTPGRLMYSVAWLSGKGFISLDWDIVDYTEMKLKDAGGIPFNSEYISEDFRVASNVRIGGEYRLNENVSLRAGGAWYQSPVSTSLEKLNAEGAYNYVSTAGTTPQYSIEKDTYYVSCGIGYHSGNFFFDAACQNQMRREHFYNYFDGTVDADYKKYSKLSCDRTQLVFTAGLKY